MARGSNLEALSKNKRRKVSNSEVQRIPPDLMNNIVPDSILELSSGVKPHVPSNTELEELDHIAINLAYQVRQLLTKFHWLKSVDLIKAEEEVGNNQMQTALLQTPRIRLASRIIQQYWNEGIPIFNYIMASSRHMATPEIPEPFPSTLNEGRTIELCSLALASLANTAEMVKHRSKGDRSFLHNYARVKAVVRNLSPARGQLPGKKDDENQDSSQATSWPPPLPEITDPKLYRQVFTHRSSIADASLKSSVEVLHTHNERLEFRGDAILDFFICELLYENYPNDAEGSLSTKKSSLVCNNTLFDISVAYKLHERIHISADLRSKMYRNANDSIPDMDVKNKALADLFEAYIAGVAFTHGLEVCHDWLRELFAPLMMSLASEVNLDYNGTNKNAKNELYSQIGASFQPIDYIAETTSAPFTVRCEIKGDVLARGTGPTVKAAGLMAADKALRDRAKVEKYAQKRRATIKVAPTTTHQ